MTSDELEQLLVQQPVAVLHRLARGRVHRHFRAGKRRLIELRMEHADLDAMIDTQSEEAPLDELMMRRLKKRRLGLRDEMSRIERELIPDEPA